MLDIVKSGFNGNGAKPTLAEHAAEIRKLDQKPAASSWRDVLPIHPAAELFPLMTPDELRSLGEDILKNGMTSPIVLWEADENTPAVLLDGRNRLDAIELVIGPPKVNRWSVFVDGRLNRGLVDTFAGHVDPYAHVISANIHRRHLTTEQKRELIAKLIKAAPEKSDRQIAETIKASPTTVGTVRAEMETKGDVSKLDTRRDSKGRKQPAKKPQRAAANATGAEKTSNKNNAAKPSGAANTAPASPTTPARNDIGSASTGEAARKDAEIEELRDAKRRLEIENTGLRSEVEELRTANAALRKSLEEASAKFVELSGQFDELRHRMGQAAPPPADDGLDIPASLRRSAQ